MGFREILQDPIEALLEPEGQVSTTTIVTKPKLALPSLNLEDATNIKLLIFVGARVILVAFLVIVGLWATGSIYGSPPLRFAGDMARVFYVYQLGTLMAIIGAIIGYDTLKRFL
jgi:hypothetical protein